MSVASQSPSAILHIAFSFRKTYTNRRRDTEFAMEGADGTTTKLSDRPPAAVLQLDQLAGRRRHVKNADFFEYASLGWSKVQRDQFSIPLLTGKWFVSEYWLYGEVHAGRLKVKTSGTRMKVLREEAMRFETDRIVPMIRERSVILQGLLSHPH